MICWWRPLVSLSAASLLECLCMFAVAMSYLRCCENISVKKVCPCIQDKKLASHFL